MLESYALRTSPSLTFANSSQLCASAPILRPLFNRYNPERTDKKIRAFRPRRQYSELDKPPSFRATIYPEVVVGPAVAKVGKVYRASMFQRISKFYNFGHHGEDIEANRTRRDRYELKGHKANKPSVSTISTMGSVDKNLPPLPRPSNS